MSVSVVVPPDYERAIDSLDILGHLQELDEDREELVRGYLAAACEYIEKITNRALVTQTLLAAFPCFPKHPIRLPRSPLQAVTSIVYTAEDGTSTTLDPAAYTVDTLSLIGRVYPAYQTDWPSTRAVPNALRVTYTAGWTEDRIPQSLKQAIRLLTAHYYEHREPVLTGTIATELAFAVEALVLPYRLDLFT
jgi:uncharacterized phiE125 gp8 family phage protein